MCADRVCHEIEARRLGVATFEMTAVVAAFLVSGSIGNATISAGEPSRITRDGLLKQRPAWSPDGKLLAFSRHRGDKIAVFLCKPDGSDERRLTRADR